MISNIKASIALILILSTLLYLFCACADKGSISDGTSVPSESEGSTENADTAPDTETTGDKRTVLAENGEYLCRIVYPRKDANGAEDAAEALRDSMNNIFGSRPKSVTDVAPSEEGILDIYIGPTIHEESKRAYENIGYGDYSITRDGTKIVVAAYESNILKTAVKALVADMKASSEEGRLMLGDSVGVTVTASAMLSSLPKPDGDTPRIYCVSEALSYVYALEDRRQEEFDTYSRALEQKGFKLYASQKIAQNSFATYHDDSTVVNLSYFSAKEAFNIAIDSKQCTALPVNETEQYTRVGKTTLSLLGCSAHGKDENGLSMFIRLADGRFIVWDGGGYNGDGDAENLHAKLTESASEVGVQKPVIAAWIITHAHGDHANAYLSYLRKHANDAEIQRLIINKTTLEYGASAAEGALSEANIVMQTSTKSKNTEVIIAHAGQHFTFADVSIDILCTLDSMMPYEFSDYNNSSIVARVEVGGKVLMTTGDAATAVWDHICKVYGEYLDCDILQVPHHGAIPGCTKAAYDLLKPETLLWPAGPQVLASVTSPSYRGYDINLYVLDTLGLRDNMHLAGLLGETTTLTF